MEPSLISLSAQQWARIAPLVERNPRRGGNAGGDHRLFVEAVLCHIRTGTPWRELPPGFGAWNSIYVRFKRWSERRTWHRIFEALADDADFQQRHLNRDVIELHRKSAAIGMYASSRVLDLLQELRDGADLPPGVR